MNMFDFLRRRVPKGQKASVRKASARKADRLGYKGRVVEMVVSKPFCSPVRDVLLTMVPAKSPGDAYYPVGWLDYQIVEQGITQIAARDLARQWKIERETRENLQYGPAAALYLPLTCWARVEVKREHADIFALTVERTGRLQVVKGDKNREGNRRMADRHRGVKPAWTRTNQVFEKSCGNGRKQWQSFADAVKEAEKLNRGRKK